MAYIYLASPYSHPEAIVRERRYQAALTCTTWLLSKRIWVYSPIVHCHTLALKSGLPFNYEFWNEYNRNMLTPAKELYVLAIEGWNRSAGVQDEILFASASMSLKFIVPTDQFNQTFEFVEEP